MPRLIDADKLKTHYCWWADGGREMTLDEAKKTFDTIIDVQPTVDAVEVVRCKDCKRNGTELCPMLFTEMKDDDFCSYGERREDAE